jgi:Pyridoxamine 5'-phosphate oxidase
MATFFPELDERQIAFIGAQRMFFTASAPVEGRVNLSPKGLDTFRVIDPNCVGYLDVTGSGNETAAHLLQNGRITFLFCAFEGPPLILRIYGKGRSVQPADPDWSALRPLFGEHLPGERQLIVADIEAVQTSCGYGVPQYAFREHRTQLPAWATRKGPDGVTAYRAEKNQVSIDGLPTGLKM